MRCIACARYAKCIKDVNPNGGLDIHQTDSSRTHPKGGSDICPNNTSRTHPTEGSDICQTDISGAHPNGGLDTHQTNTLGMHPLYWHPLQLKPRLRSHQTVKHYTNKITSPDHPLHWDKIQYIELILIKVS